MPSFPEPITTIFALEELANAAVLVSQVALEAEDTGSADLAQAAYDLAVNEVGSAITFVAQTCIYCARTAIDPETVACFDETKAKAGEIARLNRETITIALAAGAIPSRIKPKGEPPIEDEEPIQDHEQPPASPV